MENQNLSSPSINIPNKRYFTIGEASKICDVKAHVLRYWESEFKDLEPIKRKGNRRYYQQKDIILVLQIKDLLQNRGFTIDGAKNMITNTHVNTDSSTNKHLIGQIRKDLEEILSILKK
tara:strand:+ start:58 stop:414 length:357 start_codon:yes stop_codon:yes gene_type:complete